MKRNTDGDLTDVEVDKIFNEIVDFAENGPKVHFTDKGGIYVNPLHIIISEFESNEQNKAT